VIEGADPIDPTGSVSAIVVMGLMGAGKTTVGRILAGRLGWPLDDSDAAIEACEGQTVRQLREAMGTEGMHALEARHLLDALAAGRPRVVAPAAFTIEVAACRAALIAPDVAAVWLRAAPARLAARFPAGAHRPSYGHDPAAFLAEQAERRDPLFANVARIEVDVEHRTPDVTADAILEALLQCIGNAAPSVVRRV